MKYNVRKDFIENLIENSNNDNANLGYNPEVIAKYVHDKIMKQYALDIMPDEVAEAHKAGILHVHDAEYYALRPNCFNFDLRFFIRNGLIIDGKGVDGSVASPAKSLEVLLNHLLQALMAGAQVFSGGLGIANFNTFIAPLCNGRSYYDIKQTIQGFIFNCNMSLVSKGGQIIFSSVGLDMSVPEHLKDVPAVTFEGETIGTYKDYQHEANMVFKAFLEVLNEKDASGQWHRFPNCNGFNNPIIVKHNGILEIKLIGEFVEEMIKDNSMEYYDSVISDVENYEICSYNPDTDKMEWKPIIKAIRNPNQPLYRVTTKKGTYIDVTGKHPFLTLNGGKISDFDGKPLNEFSKNDRLVTSKKPLWSYSENKIGTFIGFFLGDGYNLKSNVNNRIGFTLYKKEKQDYLRNLLEELGFVYIERDNTFTILDVKQENPLCAELIADCVVMKNNQLLAKYNNSKYYLGILAGLINSDGSIYQSKRISKPSFLLKFSNTNHYLIDLFIRIGNLYGLKVKKGIKQKPQKETHNLCYDLFCGGYYMNELLNHITLHDIHKNKMFDVEFKPFNHDYGSLSIKNVEPIDYDGFTYDLEVEDNHNYFVGDCNVLSHNCLINIQDGDLDEYKGTCKVLHELGANNPTLYYTNQSNYVKTIMGCRTALPCNFTGVYDLDCLNTGNFAYTTLNLPLLALEANGNVDKFYKLLNKYCDIARDGLLNRRELVKDVIYNKHMSDFLLQRDKVTGIPLYDIDRTTITLGFCGLYECMKILNYNFGENIIQFINNKTNEYKDKDGLRWSVIASPSESASHRFATIIKEKYPEAEVQGTEGNYYLTNSSHIPVNQESNIIPHIRNANKYHPLTKGGNILHIWLGETYHDPVAIWKLNKKILGTNTNFWAFTTSFTYCNNCHNTFNEALDTCSVCDSDDLTVYSRITGYYVPVKNWNNGKKAEFKDRYLQEGI